MLFTIDLSEVKNKEELHDVLQEALPLPEYYGRNLDALYDVLTCIAEPVEIRLLNTEAAEAPDRGYIQSFLEVCKDVHEDNPLVTFSFEDRPDPRENNLLTP